MIKITDYANLGDKVKIIEFAAEQLKLDNVTVVVQNNDIILDKIGGPEWRADGLLYKTNLPSTTYSLIIRRRPEMSIQLILCHEMVHLSQYMRGDLTFDIKKNSFTWKGNKYDSSIPYKERPWEKEAFDGQSKLERAYRKSNRKCLINIFKKSK